MSRPYQFSEEPKVTSPLDRQPPKPYADGQAPSFRQDINRAKTKKWVEAKSYSYEGDDWGEYDEDDEYGVGGGPSQPLPPPKPQVGGTRSVTSPISPTAPTQLPRRPPSFDAGEERRAFSAVHPSAASADQARPVQSGADQSAASVTSSAGSVPGIAPQSADKVETADQFPQPPGASTDAPKIIRPADIYKRMVEEQERQRLASGNTGQQSANKTAPASINTAAAPSHAAENPDPQSATSPRVSLPPQLPAFRGSTFGGDDFWEPRAAQLKNIKEASGPSQPQLEHTPSSGLRSLVNRAFDAPVKSSGVHKQDSLRSAAESSVSQADTAGTSDISPIIAPVPTGSDNGDHVSTGPTRTPAAAMITTSSSPTAAESSQLPQSEISKPGLSAAGDDKPGLTIPPAHDAAGREADLARVAKNVPEHALPQLATSEMKAQESFLERQLSPPAEMSTRIARAESPSKGRVADLTTRFGTNPDGAAPVSPTSPKKSASPTKSSFPPTIQTGVAGAGLLGHTAEKSSPSRPLATREASFRPKLPGQWESYSNSAASASSEDEHVTPAAVTEVEEEEATQKTPTSSRHPEPTVDLTPTTPKHRLPFGDVQRTPAGSTTSFQAATPGTANKALGGATQKSPRSSEQYNLPARTFGEIYQRPVSLGRFDSDVTTVPPTPLPKDELSYDEPTTAAASAVMPSHDIDQPKTPRQADTPHLSVEDSPSDLESDRLRKEIVASLSPVDSPAHPLSNNMLAAKEVPTAVSRPESSVLPSEYESYWREDRPTSVIGGPGSVAHIPSKATDDSESRGFTDTAPVVPAEPLVTDTADKPYPLKKRFSWETDGATPPATAHSTATAIGPDAFSNSTSRGLEPSTIHPSVLSPEELRAEIPRISGEGLHVVNAEPEDAIASPAETPGASRGLDTSQVGNTSETIDHAGTGNANPTESTFQPPSASSSTIRRIPGVPADPKVPAFREIMSIKSPEQRIETFNSTRDVWAKHESGLSAWIQSTVKNNPQHQGVLSNEQFTAPTETFTPRHRTTSSIGGLFTKPTTAADSPNQSQHMMGNSNNMTASSATGTSNSPSQKLSTSHGAQKGKELLASAGVLGGKGLSGAKGLFAKGRQKLKAAGGNDKVDN